MGAYKTQTDNRQAGRRFHEPRPLAAPGSATSTSVIRRERLGELGPVHRRPVPVPVPEWSIPVLPTRANLELKETGPGRREHRAAPSMKADGGQRGRWDPARPVCLQTGRPCSPRLTGYRSSGTVTPGAGGAVTCPLSPRSPEEQGHWRGEAAGWCPRLLVSVSPTKSEFTSS